MKLHGWERVSSSEEYREMIKAEYYRLKDERATDGQKIGLDEVKLRLFLSLLDPPGKRALASTSDTQATVAEDPIFGS